MSEKNPTGITIRDRHLRRLKGTYLGAAEIESIFKNYNRNGIAFPTKGKLTDYKDADKYDEAIAVWTDYFNKKFNADPPLDPDVVKALMASESGFRVDPPENKKAFGITQITPSTLNIVQDPKGETKGSSRAKQVSKIKHLKFIRNIMIFSKRNDFTCGLLILFLSGCATSYFKLIKQHELAAELKATPDRVLLECEFQYKDDSGDGYGFMMHVLDDENTVLSIV